VTEQRFRVGSVPYVNAYPLIGLEPVAGLEVELAVPSRLPALLETGAVDAILVSSFYALTQPGVCIVGDVAIGSRGPVDSVRLFSKVPFGEIRHLALDSSSMTSNALAMILLQNVYGCSPEAAQHPPDLTKMLGVADAAILIGDIGMTEPGDGLEVLDLGAAWTDWTGLPFVWAVWTGREGVSAELGRLLNQSWVDWRRTLASPYANDWWSKAQARCGWPMERLQQYLTSTMRYELDADAKAGLRRFAEELASSSASRTYQTL